MIGELVVLAHGPHVALEGYLATQEAAQVVTEILLEIASRAILYNPPQRAVAVQFDIGPRRPHHQRDGARIGSHITVGPDGRADVVPGWVQDPWVTIKSDLPDLVIDVFGPRNPWSSAERQVVMNDDPGPEHYVSSDPWLVNRNDATKAAHQILNAISPYKGDLGALAVHFGSDKWGDHWYTTHYDRHFAAYRDQCVKVLEIGVGGYDDPHLGGSSLRMWKHYFNSGLIYGLDVFDKSGLNEPRILTIAGDQADTQLLASISQTYGPFDIVVDDGSHMSDDVIASFRTLFPLLRMGGLYVIEDLQTSYWPGWGGSDDATNLQLTSVGLIKQLFDGLHYQDRLGSRCNPSITDLTVSAIHLYHNIAFVEKAGNLEQPNAAWRPRNNPHA